MNLAEFILPEQQDQQTLESVGTFSEIIKEFQTQNLIKTKFGFILVNKTNDRLYVGISQSVDKQLANKDITMAQVGQLRVVKGQNKDQESRLYIVPNGGAQATAEEFLAAAAKAQPVKVGSFADLTSA